MDGLPTLIVPDDPETGAIERPSTPPPVEVDEKRLVESKPRPAATVPDPPESGRRKSTAWDKSPAPGSKQPTPRPENAEQVIQDQDDTSTPVVAISDGAGGAEANPLALPLAASPAVISSKNHKAMAKRALDAARKDRLAGGNKSVVDADMSDIAELGIGVQLYFLVLKYLGWAFLVMGIVSLPAIVVNYFGNGVTSKMVDPLKLAYASLGNQGVHPDIAADPAACLPVGDVDCTGETVNTPFTSRPETVAWIVTAVDVIYSLLFLLVYLVYRHHARRAIEQHQNEHLTPAKYAIYVRGLPSDATAKEVLEHFNTRYDPTQEERYFPLWFGCCWSRKPRKVWKSLSKGATNCSVVRNLDHLARPENASARGVTPRVGSPRVTEAMKEAMEQHEHQQMYLGTWIAEVSIAHPTGGLLRTFLAMEVLTRKISDAQALVTILELEKEQSQIAMEKAQPVGKKKPKPAFKRSDELLLQHTTKKLEKLEAAMVKKASKLKALKKMARQHQQELEEKAAEAAAKIEQEQSQPAQPATTATATATATTTPPEKPKARKKKQTAEAKAFDWSACECAFVVFNNLESRRRCLQDYRRSDRWLARRFQPRELRFRDGQYPLTILPAPEPSNILWENLEVTPRARRLRRSFTNFVTFLLLLVSGGIISAAQSAQQAFKDKSPPAGLCDASLPAIFYASEDWADARPKLDWELVWDQNATCTPETSGQERFHVAYSNGVLNPVQIRDPAVAESELNRCVEPCVSESSSDVCYTLPCFDGEARAASGASCETYTASHVLYCLCTSQLAASVEAMGLFRGPRELWTTYMPCRGFITDYVTKNVFILLASVVVVVVNLVLKSTLRGFASFERHSSESAKMSAVALKMYAAQFLNTAVIVLVVNTALSLETTPVAGELFRGKYSDFERDWYPTVGMGITMTMLLNALAPQLVLLLRLLVLSPLHRCLAQRHVRTQEQMDALYAGPRFDLAVRYPAVLNSVSVTLLFCGGSPVLLFIAALACASTFWLDKLALLRLYSVRTAFDEELGVRVLALLPWTLVAHLAFSAWMYGNTELLQAPTLRLGWLVELLGVGADGDSGDDLYSKLLAKASEIDLLGEHGFVVKLLRANVLLMFALCLSLVLALLLAAVWVRVLLPVLRQTLGIVLSVLWRRLSPLFRFCRCRCRWRWKRRVKPVEVPVDPDVVRKVEAETLANATKDTNSPPSVGRSAKVAVENTSPQGDTDATLPGALSEAAAQAKEEGDVVTALSTVESAVVKPEKTPVCDLVPPEPVMESGMSDVILPEFTDIFRKSVGPAFRPDDKLGFRRDADRPGELVRLWKQESVSNGIVRAEGEPMRTWEAMQAPVKTYAIEANDKYRLAVVELVAASKRAKERPTSGPGTSRSDQKNSQKTGGESARPQSSSAPPKEADSVAVTPADDVFPPAPSTEAPVIAAGGVKLPPLATSPNANE